MTNDIYTHGAATQGENEEQCERRKKIRLSNLLSRNANAKKSIISQTFIIFSHFSHLPQM